MLSDESATGDTAVTILGRKIVLREGTDDAKIYKERFGTRVYEKKTYRTATEASRSAQQMKRGTIERIGHEDEGGEMKAVSPPAHRCSFSLKYHPPTPTQETRYTDMYCRVATHPPTHPRKRCGTWKCTVE